MELTESVCKDKFGYEKFVLPPHNCPGLPGDANLQHTINEAKKSFLSGHSSFSFYCATFLVIYLHARLSQERTTRGAIRKRDGTRCLQAIFKALKFLQPFLQFLIYALAIYIALTRISDYRHHPFDVVTGIIVGNLFAFLILLFMVDLFRRPRSFYDAKFALIDHVIEEECQMSSENGENVYDVDGKRQNVCQQSQSSTKIQQTKETNQTTARSNKVKPGLNDANPRVEKYRVSRN